MAEDKTTRPLAAAGTMLGIGLGGFLEWIVLHQIVQLHAMLSAKFLLDSMENMKTNMTADGLFHAAVWLATLSGVVMLFNVA